MTNPLVDPNARLVIAHRGNRVKAPENTIFALRQAVELGADALEFDVRVTRDGVPVLMHDATLDRTTNGHGLIESFTFADLRTLDAGARVKHLANDRLKIPSLEEVLDAIRETPLVIEVKEIGAVEATEQLVHRFGARDRIIVGSADALVAERFYRSDLRTCASMRDAMRLIPVALAGLTPAKPGYDVLSITRKFRGMPIPVVRMAAAARKVGIATQVWTVNDPAIARMLWHGGVAGIVTDDPAAMLRARQQ
jgi:glycerophosphoryl diester phosphodiesterase